MSRNNKKKVERFGELLTNEVLEMIRENYEKQAFAEVANILKKLSEKFR